MLLAAISGLGAALVLPHPGGGAGATVVRAVDGDTLQVSVDGRSQSVRLLGIDTPETHRPGTPIECGGPQASARMAALAAPGTPVTLEPDPGQDRVDRYGRLLAYVRLPDGRLLEDEQLRAGWAMAYVYAGRPVSRFGEFRAAEQTARGARRGVWGLCGGRFHSALG
ncbi:MAG: micrococcal nuclease [Thermoleophilaceae bacterium]|nr:micrococcal nuclease [Thermoleophilaceae bacterium]